jgi:hypothetical protein
VHWARSKREQKPSIKEAYLSRAEKKQLPIELRPEIQIYDAAMMDASEFYYYPDEKGFFVREHRRIQIYNAAMMDVNDYTKRFVVREQATSKSL